jgi:hypothetical protein
LLCVADTARFTVFDFQIYRDSLCCLHVASCFMWSVKVGVKPPFAYGCKPVCR